MVAVQLARMGAAPPPGSRHRPSRLTDAVLSRSGGHAAMPGCDDGRGEGDKARRRWRRSSRGWEPSLPPVTSMTTTQPIAPVSFLTFSVYVQLQSNIILVSLTSKEENAVEEKSSVGVLASIMIYEETRQVLTLTNVTPKKPAKVKVTALISDVVADSPHKSRLAPPQLRCEVPGRFIGVELKTSDRSAVGGQDSGVHGSAVGGEEYGDDVVVGEVLRMPTTGPYVGDQRGCSADDDDDDWRPLDVGQDQGGASSDRPGVVARWQGHD